MSGPATVERRPVEPRPVELRPGYTISRVIKGGWQLAGGHGAIDGEAAVADMLAFFDAGVTTFDCADIYTGVEDLIGAFRTTLVQMRGRDAATRLKVHTKLVPDLAALPHLREEHITAIVDRSLKRLRTDRLDLVQFHWWDYAIPGAVDAALWLDKLRRAGKVHLIGGTNFDTAHVAALINAGVPIATMQVQYSVLDARPEHKLAALAAERGIVLLCYGSAAGGFLSESWLGAPEPLPPLENRSLVKYKLIIDDFGGWDLFQALLRTLHAIAAEHGTDIATIAGRFVLERPHVAAVIVGARNRAHLTANAALTDGTLTAANSAAIEAVLARRTGPSGDVYTLERDKDGRHGSIMHYNLNAAR